MALSRTLKWCCLPAALLFMCLMRTTGSTALRQTSPIITYDSLDDNGALGTVSGSIEYEVEMFFKKAISYAELMNAQPVVAELQVMERRPSDINWVQPEAHAEMTAILDRSEKDDHLLGYVLKELWSATQSAIAGVSVERCPKMSVNEFVTKAVHFSGVWGDAVAKSKFEAYQVQELDWKSKKFQTTIWNAVHESAKVDSTLGMILKKMWYCTLETMNGLRPIEL
eukprot:GHVT01074314.1.p1 GENE.GHVT01074314.1~~GHVT01074314.1.p1  ORF type:complete len:225 (+),score=20.06 GHVT01074314.1:405-1079(+)